MILASKGTNWWKTPEGYRKIGEFGKLVNSDVVAGISVFASPSGELGFKVMHQDPSYMKAIGQRDEGDEIATELEAAQQRILSERGILWPDEMFHLIQGQTGIVGDMFPEEDIHKISMIEKIEMEEEPSDEEAVSMIEEIENPPEEKKSPKGLRAIKRKPKREPGASEIISIK